MSDPTNRRKDEVIDVIRGDPAIDRQGGYFDAIRLRGRALPEVNLAAGDASTTFLGKRLSFPLLISSMTGGDHDRLRAVNRRLAEAAEAEGVALGVGSQRVMFTHPESRDSFALRDRAPTIPLLANLGAVQLNYGFGADQAREAVRAAGADALIFHLNALQEAVQPEGNTDFSGLLPKMAGIARALEVPVMLKEVGAGLSPADVERAYDAGLRMFDVAGAGGTSWSRIEYHRRPAGSDDTLGLVFQDWGLPTPELLRALRPWRARGATLIASGGLRTGLDMVKAMVLGASLCGLAAPFLPAALESADAVRAVIRRLRREFTTAMFLLGASRVAQIEDQPALLWTAPEA